MDSQELNEQLAVTKLNGIPIGSTVVFEQSIVDERLIRAWDQQAKLTNRIDNRPIELRMRHRANLHGKTAVVCHTVPLPNHPSPELFGCDFFLRFQSDDPERALNWLPAWAEEVRVVTFGLRADEERIRTKLNQMRT